MAGLQNAQIIALTSCCLVLGGGLNTTNVSFGLMAVVLDVVVLAVVVINFVVVVVVVDVVVILVVVLGVIVVVIVVVLGVVVVVVVVVLGVVIVVIVVVLGVVVVVVVVVIVGVIVVIVGVIVVVVGVVIVVIVIVGVVVTVVIGVVVVVIGVVVVMVMFGVVVVVVVIFAFLSAAAFDFLRSQNSEPMQSPESLKQNICIPKIKLSDVVIFGLGSGPETWVANPDKVRQFESLMRNSFLVFGKLLHVARLSSLGHRIAKLPGILFVAQMLK